jgi:hypothetical protein
LESNLTVTLYVEKMDYEIISWALIVARLDWTAIWHTVGLSNTIELWKKNYLRV